jgi:hypothetical protein
LHNLFISSFDVLLTKTTLIFLGFSYLINHLMKL